MLLRLTFVLTLISQTVTLAEPGQPKPDSLVILTERGYYHLGLGQTSNALIFFGQAHSLSLAHNRQDVSIKVCTGIAQAYRAVGDFERALAYERRALLYRDSLNARRQRAHVSAVQSKLDINVARQQMKILQTEKRNGIIIICLLVLLVLSAIIIVMLMMRRQRKAFRKSKAAKEQLEDLLKMKNQTALNLRDELEQKNKELTAFALNMIQKKEMLENIKEGIEEIRGRTDVGSKQKLNRVINVINLSQRMDRDWENFKLYFEQVHHGFFDNLQTIYPELNSNDLRLCALIRLNLDTRQIASVMDIAPESAKVARHRIRKKLRLEHRENLHMFFSSIPTSTQQGLINDMLNRAEARK
jgi:tetratricopeptide (TPR) repeat protein